FTVKARITRSTTACIESSRFLLELSPVRKVPAVWSNGRNNRFKALGLLLDQRALALGERLGGVFRRDVGDLLVVIPRIFGFFRLFYFEQIGRNHATAVGADHRLAEQRVLG